MMRMRGAGLMNMDLGKTLRKAPWPGVETPPPSTFHLPPATLHFHTSCLLFTSSISSMAFQTNDRGSKSIAELQLIIFVRR